MWKSMLPWAQNADFVSGRPENRLWILFHHGFSCWPLFVSVRYTSFAPASVFICLSSFVSLSVRCLSTLVFVVWVSRPHFSPSVFLCPWQCVTQFLSLCTSVAVCLSVYLPFSVSVSVSISLTLSFHSAYFLSASLCHFLYIFLFNSNFFA